MKTAMKPAVVLALMEAIESFESSCEKNHSYEVAVSNLRKSLELAGFVILPREPDEGTCEAGAEALRGEFPLVGSRRQTLHGWGAFYSYHAMVQHYESKGEAE